MSVKPKILCVDDMTENMKVRAMLLELFGCEVLTAQDHRSALSACEDGGIDLLLIDYHLGDGATGEDIARDVRVLKPEIPMVMLTGDSNLPKSAIECVDAVIIKGASSPADLLDALQRLLPKAAFRPRRERPVYAPRKTG